VICSSTFSSLFDAFLINFLELPDDHIGIEPDHQHLLYGRPSPPGFDNAAQDGGGPLRQEDHAAVGVHEKLDPIAGLQPEMLPDSLRNVCLPFVVIADSTLKV
jgi:hypothetical protein